MSTYPWNYDLKWPLTRVERLQELDNLTSHYEKTLQKDNINAAKAWHSQFPRDQTIPHELLIFQAGKKVRESDINLENGVVWCEVSKGYIVPCGISTDQAHFRVLPSMISDIHRLFVIARPAVV